MFTSADTCFAPPTPPHLLFVCADKSGKGPEQPGHFRVNRHESESINSPGAWSRAIRDRKLSGF